MEPKEMVLVALRKCGKLVEKSSYNFSAHQHRHVVVGYSLCGLFSHIHFAKDRLDKLETCGAIAANIR